jgi:hypothetical protein
LKTVYTKHLIGLSRWVRLAIVAKANRVKEFKFL